MRQNCNTSLTVKGECCVNNPIFSSRLPITVTEIGHCRANSDFFLERVDGNYYTIVITVSGQGKLHYKNDDFTVNKKHAFMLDTRFYHRIETDGDDWEFYYFDVNGPAMENYCMLCEELGTAVGMPEKQSELILLVEKCVKLIKEKKHYRDIQLSMAVTEIITKLLMSNIKNTELSASEKYQMIKDAIEYINEHYSQDIGVDEISSHASLSKYYFIKLFRNHTGLTPYEYLLNKRIAEAKVLLRETDMPMDKIAVKTGFSEATAFSRCFRRVTGLTPIAFRKTSMDYNDK